MSFTSVKSNQRVRNAAARRVIYTAFSTVALSLFGISAHARDIRDIQEDAPAQKVVSYADLDLSQHEGAHMLYARLQGAAKYVCRGLDGKDLRRTQLHRVCYEKALGDAVASVDKSTVTALYRSDKTIRLAQQAERTRRST